ncbi:Hypothetical predicted protein [Octopus vulgaris]|uniref:Tc1-like transposase DDE domain-containing protein n=1 Tax=Octopus vulgaris TaxID=6645 RepID=A0AA36FKH4_OCTVU|nr:Hypothetical predicted protein [Octopus vulgaris]
MNSTWQQNILVNNFLFGEETCIIQQDGALFYTARRIKKYLGDKDIEILEPWPGNSPDLNPTENLRSILKIRVDREKPINIERLEALVQQEWWFVNRTNSIISFQHTYTNYERLEK